MTQTILRQANNAAVVNISGRQRMLSQRLALFCMRLVSSQAPGERQALKKVLGDLILLMERSHRGLIYGDRALSLPGKPSGAVMAMYFKSPLNVDRQMQNFLTSARNLLEAPDSALKPDHPDLQKIVKAASCHLLAALDAVVNQYQEESEAEQRQVEACQLALYQHSCFAAREARIKAQHLQKTLIKLSQIQAQLIQTEKMSSLGLLVGGVAHEINNPMNFISSNLPFLRKYIEILLDVVGLYQKHYPNPVADIQIFAQAADLEFLQEDLPKVLDSMDIGTERIQQIVLSLRNFSRLDEAELKPAHLHEGIENTLLILRHRLKAHHQRPEIQVLRHYGALPAIDCCPGQLNQCFMNLLVNAIDAIDELYASTSPSGQVDNRFSPQIIIETAQTSEDWIEVVISDSGIGIPDDIQQRILEPFFTTKPVGKGTGMGLSISYSIITEKHNGQLSFRPRTPWGTEWRIKLPVRQANQAALGVTGCAAITFPELATLD